MKIQRELLGISLCSVMSLPAFAADEVKQIQRELQELRQLYETRIQALEKRLEAAETNAQDARLAANQAVARTQAPVDQDPAMAGGRGRISGNEFNPAISAIVQAKLNQYSEDPAGDVIPGFQVGGETGLPPEGFSLDETEVTISANVDQVFYGEITVGLHEDEGETEVDIEEAFFDTLGLPGGFGVRGGRFYSGIGYLNRFHTHTWGFHDAPLAYKAFLGGQYGDDGIRVSWLAPTDLYLNFGAEFLQGNSFPGAETDAEFGDSRTLFMQLGGDLNVSNSWRVGLSGLAMDTVDRAGGGHAHDAGDGGSLFSGDSDLVIADFVWKWAPNGNPRYRNFTFTSEYFYRDEQGDVLFSEGGSSANLAYDGTQQGIYVQGVYQFMPRWRVGLRYDRLDSDNSLVITSLGGLDEAEVLEEVGLRDAADQPERWSLMADYSPSEFSRLRLQYDRDDSRVETTDHQWTLQYIMSLGAHGAHEY